MYLAQENFRSNSTSLLLLFLLLRQSHVYVVKECKTGCSISSYQLGEFIIMGRPFVITTKATGEFFRIMTSLGYDRIRTAEAPGAEQRTKTYSLAFKPIYRSVGDGVEARSLCLAISYVAN